MKQRTWQQVLGRLFVQLGVLASVALVGSCIEPFDTTRIERPERTLGQEIYLELCQRVGAGENANDVTGAETRDLCENGVAPEATPMPRTRALLAAEPRLIAALDGLLHDELPSDLRKFLTALLPLYDNGVIEAQSDAIADLLQTFLDDPATLGSLERMSWRHGYRPFGQDIGVIRLLLDEVSLQEQRDALVDFLATEPGDQAWHGLAESLLHSLQNLSDGYSDDPDGLYALLQTTLLNRAVAFSDGTPRYVARRDQRGIVTLNHGAKGLLTPFTDQDGDGLADVDSAGRFVDGEGMVLDLAQPFAVAAESVEIERDGFGRLLAQGELTYEYVDASQTLLAGLVFEGHRLLQPERELLWDFVDPLLALLGPEAERRHNYADDSRQEYVGFDLRSSLLLDAAHLLAATVHPDTVQTVGLVSRLLLEQEPLMAAALQLAWHVSDWLDEPAFAKAKVDPNANMIDELLETFAEVLRADEGALFLDLMQALEDPQTQRLGELLAKQMRFKDAIDFNPDDLNAPPVGELVTPVDRSQPDTVANRSLFQRFLHLVHDTAGVKLCNKEGAQLVNHDGGLLSYTVYGACDLVAIADMSVFYLQSITGTARMQIEDEVARNLMDAFAEASGGTRHGLEWMSGITGLRGLPTVEATNRLMFAPRSVPMQAIMDPPLSSDGVALEERHAGTIFGLELDGFYDAFRPLLKPFVARGREKLLVKLLGLLHRHWSSKESDSTQSEDPQAPAFSLQSGLVDFEELFARTLVDEGGMRLAGKMVKTLRPDEKVALMRGARHLVLPEHHGELTFRGGRKQATKSDGVSPTDGVTPIYLGFALLDDGAAWLDAHPQLDDVIERAVDRWLEVVTSSTGEPTRSQELRLADRRALALALTFLEVIDERLQKHVARGDVSQWASRFVPDTQDVLDHPLLATSSQLLLAAREHPGTHVAVLKLADRLLGDGPLSEAGVDWLVSFAVDMLQGATDAKTLVPMAHSLAPVFEAGDGLLAQGLDFLHDVTPLDRKNVLLRLIQGLVQEMPTAEQGSILGTLADVASEVNRADPGQVAPFLAADYCALFGNVVDFLVNDETGLGRLYMLAANRGETGETP